MRLKVFAIAPLILSLSAPAFAQGPQRKNTSVHTQGYNPGQGYNSGTQTPAATQPSTSPFQNPIGQGVPPAASANPNYNSNRTNVPR